MIQVTVLGAVCNCGDRRSGCKSVNSHIGRGYSLVDSYTSVTRLYTHTSDQSLSGVASINPTYMSTPKTSALVSLGSSTVVISLLRYLHV